MGTSFHSNRNTCLLLKVYTGNLTGPGHAQPFFFTRRESPSAFSLFSIRKRFQTYGFSARLSDLSHGSRYPWKSVRHGEGQETFPDPKTGFFFLPHRKNPDSPFSEKKLRTRPREEFPGFRSTFSNCIPSLFRNAYRIRRSGCRCFLYRTDSRQIG